MVFTSSVASTHEAKQARVPTTTRLPRLKSAGLAAGPDGQAERDLVHEVRKVVDQVQSGRGHTATQVPEEVPERVDRPTDRHDATHGAEGGLYMLVHGAAGSVHLASLPVEDLVQDVPPPAHPQNEANGGIDEVRLASVAEHQHRHGADHQPPEHPGADVRLHCLQDQVELDHLQGNGDRPINVTVEDRGAVNQDPELAHV